MARLFTIRDSTQGADPFRGMGTSYNVPVKREMKIFRKILPPVETTTYKTLLILETPFPMNPMTDLSLTRRISRP